jgi:antitoxin component YwqK of YwqJK toxin-antitoxin module
MKILLTLLSIFILFSCSPSEISSNHLIQIEGLAFKKDSKKPYSGVVADYYQNGQLRKKVNYERGIIIDEYVEVFLDNGQPDAIYYYINGKENRYVDYIYYENGNIKAKKTYIDNFLNGLLEEFYDNGKVKLRHTYLNGKLDGPYEEYSNDGKQLFKAEYRSTVPYDRTVTRNGIRYEINSNTPFTGELAHIDESCKFNLFTDNIVCSNLLIKLIYKNGLLNGHEETYYEDGQLKATRKWVNGKKEGLSKYFHPNGQLWETQNYVNNKLEGLVKTFHDNGQLKEKIFFKEGKKQGLYEYFTKSGLTFMRLRYKDDVIVQPGEKCNKNGDFSSHFFLESNFGSVNFIDGFCQISKLKTSYFENGKIKARRHIDESGNGPYEAYHESGQLHGIGFILNDELHGPNTSYYENGKIEIKSIYTKGTLNGFYEKYYENGQLEARGTYEDDKKNGLFEFFYQNGEFKAMINFNKDKLHGPAEYWSETGELMSQDIYENDELISSE